MHWPVNSNILPSHHPFTSSQAQTGASWLKYPGNRGTWTPPPQFWPPGKEFTLSSSWQSQHKWTASLCKSFIFIPQLLFPETYTYNHCWESIGKLIIVKSLHESNCSVSSELPILILLWEGIIERNGTLETGKYCYQNNLTNANTAPSINRSVESKSTDRCSLWIQLCWWRALCPPAAPRCPLLKSLSLGSAPIRWGRASPAHMDHHKPAQLVLPPGSAPAQTLCPSHGSDLLNSPDGNRSSPCIGTLLLKP